MKILVTGAAGYIGQHLCRMLSLNKEYTVLRTDLDMPSEESGMLYERNIRDPENFIGLRVDAVVHLAALVRIGESVMQPSEYYETNLQGTINLLRHIDYKNFIFASTGAAGKPNSPYAYSKLCAEQVVKELVPEDYTIFRFFNVIGSEGGIQPTNPDGLFSALIRASKTKRFYLYGDDYYTQDGSAIRDYVHVNDICLAIYRAILKPARGIEHLGYGDTTSVLEMVDAFKRANGVEFEVIHKSRRRGDVESSYCCVGSDYMSRNYTLEEMLVIPKEK